MKTASAEHGQNMFCACGFHGNSMNNLLSSCGLVDAKIRASENYLPVLTIYLVYLLVTVGIIFQFWNPCINFEFFVAACLLLKNYEYSFIMGDLFIC